MPDTANPSATLSLGARLRAARERTGMEKQQAAEKLHCDVAIIDDLENNRFEALGAQVYARGHVRRYAELVGESPAEAQELFAQLATQVAAMPDLTRIAKAERPADPRSLAAPLAVAAVTVLLAALAWWVLKGAPPRNLTDVVPIANNAAAPAQGAAALSPPGTSPIPSSNPNQAPMTGLPQPAPVQPGPAIADEVGREHNLTANPALPAPGALQLRLTADTDCWIEAYDAAGKRIYFGMASPKSVQQIEGVAPLRVLLGSVKAVKLEIGGKLAIVPDSVRRGTSAWFAVTADGQIKPTADLPTPLASENHKSAKPKAPAKARAKRP